MQEIRAQDAVTRIANAPEFIMGVVNLRGSIVTIVDLRVKLGFAPTGVGGTPVVIILSIARQLVGVVVDAVCDVIALAREQVRPAPEVGGALGGGCIRGIAPVDERMLIVFDIARLMDEELSLISRKAA